jgi:hypothetical protein
VNKAHIVIALIASFAAGEASIIAAFFLLTPLLAREACRQVLGGRRYQAEPVTRTAQAPVLTAPARREPIPHGPVTAVPARKAVER